MYELLTESFITARCRTFEAKCSALLILGSGEMACSASDIF